MVSWGFKTTVWDGDLPEHNVNKFATVVNVSSPLCGMETLLVYKAFDIHLKVSSPLCGMETLSWERHEYLKFLVLSPLCGMEKSF